MIDDKKRVLRFEIVGSVQGKNLIRQNKILLRAERPVIQQFLYEVLKEVLENIKQSGVENVRSENNKLN